MDASEKETSTPESNAAGSPQHQLARERDRLKLLLDINNAVVSHLDLNELMHVISGSLKQVVPHDVSGIGLYDAESGELRAHVLEYPGQLPAFARGTVIPMKGTTGGEAFSTGQPVFVGKPDHERFDSDYAKQTFEVGIRSGGSIPLIAHGRKLGVLGIASMRENAFSEDDIELLVQVGTQVALAVDNALNFEAVRKAEQQMSHDRDRLRLLLDVNNAVVAHLDLTALMKAISASLRGVIHHDFAGLALYEPETNQLRALTLEYEGSLSLPDEGSVFPIEGSPSGLAFTTSRPVYMSRPDPVRFPSPFLRRFTDRGLKSLCSVPLISHGRTMGVLMVMSLREDSFNEADIDLLTEIGKQVAIAVENAMAFDELSRIKNKLTDEKLYLEEEINTAYDFEQIIGSSVALKRILKQVETVAPTDSTVLIQGETGTGKELIARAIHSLSGRRERTLVKLNCAAIPMGLLESELFGHEKGAFTGAIAQRIGRFELAHKGTLFLDEVGEIPQELQSKLLRVLQEREFERLGSTRTISVDARMVAATNRDLEQMVAERRFRDDLFYRLNVFPITIPPLRDRPDDIPLLVRFFANKFARRMKKRIETIPAETITGLKQYHWPGNIRELENLIERAVILAQKTELHVPIAEMKPPPKPVAQVPAAAEATAEPSSLESIEREHILRVLRETNWVVGGPEGAAARLGLKRTTLQARMKKLGIARHLTAP